MLNGSADVSYSDISDDSGEFQNHTRNLQLVSFWNLTKASSSLLGLNTFYDLFGDDDVAMYDFDNTSYDEGIFRFVFSFHIRNFSYE